MHWVHSSLYTHCLPASKRVTPSSFSSSSTGVQRLWHCFVPVCRAEPLRPGRGPVGVGGEGHCAAEVWEGHKCKQWKKKKNKQKLKCYSSVVLKRPIFFHGDCKRNKGEKPQIQNMHCHLLVNREPRPALPFWLPLCYSILSHCRKNGSVRKRPCMYFVSVLHAKNRRASSHMGFAETKDKAPHPVVGAGSIPMLAFNIYDTSLTAPLWQEWRSR